MGAPVNAPDLRAGAALVVAGLAASGVTEIDSISHIERGYQDIISKLRSLGADIERITEVTAADQPVAKAG
jgi:UDP-N-acetylglucosamine 1-carboxyvinyltransferase